MSLQLLRQGIRLRADARSRQPLLDFYTNATPQGWVRAATQFEIALASGGSLVDVTNLASVTIEAAPCANRDGARVFSKTLAGSALDPGLTEATWADGSRQHALFILNSGEMNIALPTGTDRAGFWLVVTALTTAGDPLVCGAGLFALADDGTFNNAPPPPANPGAGITIDQADARYLRGGGGFIPTVTSVGDGAPGSLEELPTSGLILPVMRTVYLPASDELQDWLLLASASANAVDANGHPSIQRPNDFDATANARAWFRKR